MELLNEVENLLRWLGLPAVLGEGGPNPVVDQAWVGCHPQQYRGVRLMGKNAGAAFTVHPLIRRALKIKGQLALAVLDLTDGEHREWPSKVRYQPLPKYPSSTFDCTVVSDLRTPAGTLLKALKKVKLKELQQFKVVEVFTPEAESTQKFVTLRAVFGDPQGTLSSDMVKRCEQAVVEALERAGFPLRPS